MNISQETLQSLIVPSLSALSAFAAAVAAWGSHKSARDTLAFQKRLAKHQDSLFLLRSTIESLWQHKRIFSDPLAAPDLDFANLVDAHSLIKRKMRDLVESGVLLPRDSGFFNASTEIEIAARIGEAVEEIDKEIQRMQAKINEIYA